MPAPSLLSAARTLGRRLDELGRVSQERGALTRTFLSPAMRRAVGKVAAWMREVDLEVKIDAVGNVIGRADAAVRPPAARTKTLLLGSHLDTVRDAGRFDGALGVLLPIAALAELRRRRIALPFAVEIVGFSEEEGVRFSSSYLGSKGFAGRLTAADLAKTDADGITVRQAIERWNRVPFRLPRRAHAPSELLGYFEAHIEQGPVLEARGLAAGVVSAIAGQTRVRASFHGRAGHAGTTPMALRRDALAGASEFVLAAERAARASPPLVATVGQMSVAPGAANVIPGRVEFSLDVRHPGDARRQAALAGFRALGRAIGKRRGLEFFFEIVQDNPSVACSPGLTAALRQSVRAAQGSCADLASGAGHDGVVVSSLAPIAMLFVRCRGGLSHHPDEHVASADLETALRVVVDFMMRLGRREGGT